MSNRPRAGFNTGMAIGATGMAVGVWLGMRRAAKGPGMLTTLIHLVLALGTLTFVPLVGGIWWVYATSRITRRIGQVDFYAWTTRDTLTQASSNGTIWAAAGMVAFGALAQFVDLLGDFTFIAVLICGAALLAIAVKNGVEMKRMIEAALAQEAAEQ